MKPPYFTPLRQLTMAGLCLLLLSFILGQGCSTPAESAQAASAPVTKPLVRGLWLAPEEIAALPMTGPAWEQLKNAADQVIGHPDLSDQDTTVNTLVLAKALVFARTGEAPYRQAVVAALTTIIEEKSRTRPDLSLGARIGCLHFGCRSDRFTHL